jgi:hypothetical protein
MRLAIEYHYYFSDDRKYDNLFVQYAFVLHWHHLISNIQLFKMHYVWNDGYAS